MLVPLGGSYEVFEPYGQSLVNWDSILPIERKKLLHAVLEAAFVWQNALVALQPTVTFLPMFGEKRCSCGPEFMARNW